MEYTLSFDVTDNKAGLVSQLFTEQRGWADGREQQVWKIKKNKKKWQCSPNTYIRIGIIEFGFILLFNHV